MIAKSSASKVSIAVAASLALIKGLSGFFIGSLALLTSAVDSILDVIASSVNYFAIKKSEEPPDEDHPFGHSKFESMATFLQSIIIFFSGAFILYKSYEKIKIKGVVENVDAGIYVMFISVAVTICLSIFLKKVARQTESSVLKADALHYDMDILTNAGIIVTFFVIKLTGFHVVDAIISVIISFYIIYSSVKLNFEVSKDLLDVELPKNLKEEIIKIIEEYDSLHMDYHKLRTRRAGSKKFVDMHLTLCRNLSLEDAHIISDFIESRIRETIADSDVTIHIDPCDVSECPGIDACNDNKLKLELSKIKNGGEHV